ncbi:tumor necrosis factor receptor superfamily member 13C-like isoform X2 [Cebidichthys violaceus]|uniref:tumor necrosis factor receptor superfamily member 13C-like isoform X2 n=1 Tax=Cebidichthys violaceus TaxID=271503 RepID=UPI0035CA93BB
MAKKDCPAGRKWDSLVSICFPESETRPEPGPSTERPLATVVQLRSTAPTAHSVMLLSPALWIFVVLATLGSILALALWFIIYKRQTRHSSTSEEAGLQQEPLQKTEPPAKSQPPPSERNGQAEMLQRAAWTVSPCSHLHLGAQTGKKWEEGFTACSDPAKHAGTEGFRGLPTCSTTREHRIPLPATELGGTVLVTTKTV